MSRRVFDCILAGFAGVLVAVPLALSALAITLSDGGPVIYRQTRVGRNGRRFWLCKLRTMSSSSTGPHVTPTGDSRVSRVGRVLRQYKLDELPQLWNVLQGDMSIVGPRPEVPRFVQRYTAAQREILNAKPGLASVAQLVYPHEAALLHEQADPESAYEQHLMPLKIEADLAYERVRTPWSDVRLIVEIMLLIVWKSFRMDRAIQLPGSLARPTRHLPL